MSYQKHRKMNLKARYGLTPDEVEAMWLSQKKRCAATGWPIRIDRDASETQGAVAEVDHCHYTGVVRGLLHPAANSAIGGLRESVMAFAGCASYVSNTKESEGLLAYRENNKENT